MRKQMKIAALTSAAALLAIGASMTSFAKWVPVGDGTQMWVDNYGDPEAGWHRYNGEYFCTDDDGRVITNSLISSDGYVDDLSADTVYYVDSLGFRARNYWVSVPNDDEIVVNGTDGTEYAPSTLYLYAGAKRAITKRTDGLNLAAKVNKTSSTTDTGIFVFNPDGYMMGGEVTAMDGTGSSAKSGTYYCVTLDDLADNLIELEEGTLAEKYVEGQALVGWAKFYDSSLAADNDYVWRYYDNGKLVTGEKAISWQGKTSTYYFDANGDLETDKSVVPSRKATMPNATENNGNKVAGSVNFVVKNNDGVIVTQPGWYSKDEDGDGKAEWYYIVNVIDNSHKLVKGVVFNASVDGKGQKRAKVIDGKTYVFGPDGKMLDGIQTIDYTGSDATYTDEAWYGITCTKLNDGKFYFNNKADSGHRGEMETGRVTYTDGDLEVTSYIDPVMGLMTNAIIRDYYYDANGCLYTALDDTYEFVSLKGTTIKAYVLKSGKQLDTATGKVTTLAVPSGASDAWIIVDRNGRVLKGTNATKKIWDSTYSINGYVATEKN